MKPVEEPNARKNEIETDEAKHAELTEEELKQVPGGVLIYEYCPICGSKLDLIPDDRSTNFTLVCPDPDCGYSEVY